MRASWRQFYRRVAAVFVVAGATSAWSSAVCYAQLAADNASDAAYADGWQAGDNGGHGFQPWNFDNDTLFHVEGIRDIDSSNPFNQVGTAWRLGLNYLGEGKDIVRVGRGLGSPLQTGQTITIVADPPGDTQFFDIETIRFNTGGGNICYGGAGCTSGTAPESRFSWSFFNWTDMNEWGRWTASSLGATSLFNVDKAPLEHPEFPDGAFGTDMGMRLEFTLTGPETFDLTVTPLDNPAAAISGSGSLDNPGAGTIDWIEFLHYGSESVDGIATDFYIRSLEVAGASAPSADFDENGLIDGEDFKNWQTGFGVNSGASPDMGDADHDGDVDANDLSLWKQQFGAAATSAAQAIPEPAAWAYMGEALAGLSLSAGAARRRCSRRRRS